MLCQVYLMNQQFLIIYMPGRLDIRIVLPTVMHFDLAGLKLKFHFTLYDTHRSMSDWSPAMDEHTSVISSA